MSSNKVVCVGKSTFAVLLICAGSAVFLVPQFVQAAGPAADLRQTLNFNRDWKFLLGDHPGAQAVGYDDAGWEDIGLPHSFSLPYFASPEFYVGYGWYRKHFDVPPQWSGKRMFLEFDGVFQVAEIFVNGQAHRRTQGRLHRIFLRHHPCGANRQQRGRRAASTTIGTRSSPRARANTFSAAGFIATCGWSSPTPLHVTWYGTFVTTPEVSKASGTVNVKTEVLQ